MINDLKIDREFYQLKIKEFKKLISEGGDTAQLNQSIKEYTQYIKEIDLEIKEWEAGVINSPEPIVPNIEDIEFIFKDLNE